MLSNTEIKYYGSLKHKRFRVAEEKFLIEGFHLVEECMKSSYKLECVIFNEKTDDEKKEQMLTFLKRKNIPIYETKEKNFKKLKETEHSQGVIGVVVQKKDLRFDVLANGRLVIALDSINDPGNFGTIIRTAYWFGADCILSGKGSVDIYNSKVLRSTQGAIFHSAIHTDVDLPGKLNLLNKNGYSVYLMSQDGNISLKEIDHFDKTVFVFGNESDGISEALLKDCFDKVKIDGFSDCESLNVAVSCGIVLNHYRNIQSG
ncbi:MAG: RNA methyltransferase [Ignavibacteria bacterium]|jgi:TrmH family RNA methyltransferase